MPELRDFLDEMRSLAHELSDRVDMIDQEQRRLQSELASKTGQVPGEFKTAIDRLNARLNDLTDQIERVRLLQSRPPLGTGGPDDPYGGGRVTRVPPSEARAAFLKAIRYRGDLSLLTPEEKRHIVYEYMPSEQKAMYAGDATTGGFFASTDFIDELMAYQLLISPMRKICRVQRTSGEKVQMPALANDTTAYWAVEQQNYFDSQTPTLSMIKISQQNLEDSQFDLEGFIKDRLSKQFARTEGAAFVAGDGNGKPRGILGYPIKASASYPGGSAGKANVVDAIPYVPSGNNSNITADSILSVFMDLKSYYAPNATWIFTRATLNTIRLFKDQMGRPLWQPFAASNLPATIYDRPYVEMPDMPEISPGSYPVVVGDFSYYMIVDRVGLNMQQLNELFAVAGLVGFIARQRVGGDVLLPEAFRVLKVGQS
jgi:HK97 family phage major capsid protein